MILLQSDELKNYNKVIHVQQIVIHVFIKMGILQKLSDSPDKANFQKTQLVASYYSTYHSLPMMNSTFCFYDKLSKIGIFLQNTHIFCLQKVLQYGYYMGCI